MPAATSREGVSVRRGVEASHAPRSKPLVDTESAVPAGSVSRSRMPKKSSGASACRPTTAQSPGFRTTDAAGVKRRPSRKAPRGGGSLLGPGEPTIGSAWWSRKICSTRSDDLEFGIVGT